MVAAVGTDRPSEGTVEAAVFFRPPNPTPSPVAEDVMAVVANPFNFSPPLEGFEVGRAMPNPRPVVPPRPAAVKLVGLTAAVVAAGCGRERPSLAVVGATLAAVVEVPVNVE